MMRRPDGTALLALALDALSRFEEESRKYEQFTEQKVNEWLDAGKDRATAEHLAGSHPKVVQAGKRAIWFREKADMYRGMAALILTAEQIDPRIVTDAMQLRAKGK